MTEPGSVRRTRRTERPVCFKKHRQRSAVAFPARSPQTGVMSSPHPIDMHGPSPVPPPPLGSGPNTSDSPRLPRGIFVLIVLAAIAQCVFSFSQLPERMASHFGPSGLPNGWMTKQSFFIVYALVIAVASVLEFLPARSIARSSPSSLHLPNKEYWLAPERRAQTFAYFTKFFAWYGCAILLVLVVAMGLAINANLNPPPRLAARPILAAIGGFVLFSILSIAHLMRRFSKVS